MRPTRRARQRAAEVLGVDAEAFTVPQGYADLIGGAPTPTGLAQRLMTGRAVPAVYERWWRPALARAVKGPRGPSMAREVDVVRRLLAIQPGAAVVDVACGPGSYTRALADDAGDDGVVIGLDVSTAMLARAVAGTRRNNVVYARADVTRMQLTRQSVDAVGCFAALHLFADPWAALDLMTDALVVGGRLAVLTTARPRRRVAACSADVAGRASGLRVFDEQELTAALANRGLEVTEQQRFGLLQLVGATRRSGREGR